MIATRPQIARPASRSWNTLRRLKLLRLSLLTLDGLVLVCVLSTAQQMGEAVHVIRGEAAPDIVAARQAQTALSAMDSAFVAGLFSGTISGKKEDGAAGDAYAVRHTEVVRRLIDAAEHGPSDGSERQSLETLEVGLGSYERLLQHARDVSDRDAAAALPVYSKAAAVLDAQLLPAAASLVTLGQAAMAKAEDAQRFHYGAATALRVICGLLLILLLLTTQLFLSRRTHRTLNPALLAATLLAVAAGLHLGSTLSRAEAELHSGTEEEFAAAQQALETRSVVAAADDSQSRALLDRSHAQHWETLASQGFAVVATVPPQLSREQLLDALREGHNVDGFAGYLAAETDRQAVNGDRGPAITAVAAWQSYVAASRHMIQLEQSGQHHEALALLTGPAPTQLPSLRDQMDRSLSDMHAIHQAAFDADMRDVATASRSAMLEACGTGALLAAFVLLGLEPRLREYRQQ